MPAGASSGQLGLTYMTLRALISGLVARLRLECYSRIGLGNMFGAACRTAGKCPTIGAYLMVNTRLACLGLAVGCQDCPSPTDRSWEKLNIQNRMYIIGQNAIRTSALNPLVIIGLIAPFDPQERFDMRRVRA